MQVGKTGALRVRFEAGGAVTVMGDAVPRVELCDFVSSATSAESTGAVIDNSTASRRMSLMVYQARLLKMESMLHFEDPKIRVSLLIDETRLKAQ